MTSREHEIEELKEGIDYLDFSIPKIKRKELSYSEATKVVNFFEHLYTKFFGTRPNGLTEEVERIYGRKF